MMAENTRQAGSEELSWSSQSDIQNFKAIFSPIFAWYYIAWWVCCCCCCLIFVCLWFFDCLGFFGNKSAWGGFPGVESCQLFRLIAQRKLIDRRSIRTL